MFKYWSELVTTTFSSYRSVVIKHGAGKKALPHQFDEGADSSKAVVDWQLLELRCRHVLERVLSVHKVLR